MVGVVVFSVPNLTRFITKAAQAQDNLYQGVRHDLPNIERLPLEADEFRVWTYYTPGKFINSAMIMDYLPLKCLNDYLLYRYPHDRFTKADDLRKGRYVISCRQWLPEMELFQRQEPVANFAFHYAVAPGFLGLPPGSTINCHQELCVAERPKSLAARGRTPTKLTHSSACGDLSIEIPAINHGGS